tara:strand:- start:2365 stop:2964 length:600 start_codon:yes stop_codon:yes gene_type:complete
MGVLDNTTITVDAILTKKGRELLAKGESQFKITKFALADDEIDYGLYDVTHPNGSNFYGTAIENMNLLEAVPNEQLSVKYFLTSDTTETGTNVVVRINGDTSITAGSQAIYNGVTDNDNETTYNWELDSTEYAYIGFQQMAEEGGGLGNLSDNASNSPSVTIIARPEAALNGQDRQVTLKAIGTQTGEPAVKVITITQN